MDLQPWWDRYRKRKYKRSHLSLEMIIRKSFVETVKEYLASSSIAGVGQITSEKNSVLQRLFWMGLLCFFFVVVVFFLQYTWVSTLSKPLVVSGESYTYPISNIDFPAVALCNINRISKKALDKLAVEMYPKVAKLNTTVKMLRYFFRDFGRLIDLGYNPVWPTEKFMEFFASEEFSEETVGIMKALAPSCEEMLVKCSWAGKVKDCMSIFRVRRTILGHCCVFNYVLDYESGERPKGTLEEVKRQTVPGLTTGLRVIIDAMVHDYEYPINYRNGFELLLFDPTHFPDMTGGRLVQRNVQPGQVELFQIRSIKQVAAAEVRKYPIKTRKCLFHDEYASQFRNMYSYSACIEKCRIQSVQSLCQCTPFFMPITTSTLTKTCTMKDLKCLNKYKEKLQYLYPIDTVDTEGLEQEVADSLYCPECLPDCELTQHFTKSFKIRMPDGIQRDRGFGNFFLKGLNLTDKCVVLVFQVTSEGILHRLDVVSYWFEILSSIGGFSGMLMGIGIFTFVEVIYFIFIRFLQVTYSNYLKYS